MKIVTSPHSHHENTSLGHVYLRPPQSLEQSVNISVAVTPAVTSILILSDGLEGSLANLVEIHSLGWPRKE